MRRARSTHARAAAPYPMRTFRPTSVSAKRPDAGVYLFPILHSG